MKKKRKKFELRVKNLEEGNEKGRKRKKKKKRRNK